MATTKDKYYTEMLEILVDYKDSNNAPLYNEKIRQSVKRVVKKRKRKNMTPNVTPIV